MGDGWNFADVWEAVADRFGDRLALAHGSRELTWRELDQRADGLGATMLDAGLDRQAKVAQLLRNRPDYLETMFAAFKAGLVPVNTNYRYGAEELVYLWGDCDAAAVVFEAEFTEVVEQVRHRLPGVVLWLRIDDEERCPRWAVPYEAAVTSRRGRLEPIWGRSGDDVFLLYTGGTTGRPKGVIWRQDDLFRMLESSAGAEPVDSFDPRAMVAGLTKPGTTVMPAAPLMHGTACWFVLPVLARGGTVVTLVDVSLDPVELLDTVVDRQVKGLCIVGDAFARPLLAALEGAPDRWDLSGLRVLFSSGAMLSQDSKRRLLRFAPRAQVIDGLGSSESGTVGRSVTAGDGAAPSASFRLSAGTRVIDEDGNDVEPGSPQAGRLAVGGHLPIGYYRDPDKTASTFIEIAGRRYVMVGDWASVAADGSITLLGRGSSCINTAGEKVFPEEVEEVLKTAPGVRDAGVVGLPDERFGEAVTAVVLLDPESNFDEAALIDHVKHRLARYKAPKRVVAVESFPRGPNGKVDHQLLKAQARLALGAGR